jgi:hypothetical protein
MGIATNPRGRLRQAQRVDGEILRMVAGDLMPDSLTPAELELDVNPVTRPARAEPAWAWVHYGGHAVRVEAEIVGWTADACAVRWEVPKLGVHRAWVWKQACRERIPGE